MQQEEKLGVGTRREVFESQNPGSERVENAVRSQAFVEIAEWKGAKAEGTQENRDIVDKWKDAVTSSLSHFPVYLEADFGKG